MQVNGSSQTSVSTLGAPQTDNTSTNLGPDAFMRLLVTQVRNQDPMQPMDTTAMMAQLTQLTEVERLVAIDGRLQNLQISSLGIANAQAADLVGRTVEADTSQMTLLDGGAATGTFELTGASQTTRVEIRDAEGRLVRTLDLGAQGRGTRTFTWDGLDDSGNRADPGRYRISVTAADADGHAVETRTRIRGPVGAVRYEDGYPELVIGEAEVLMGDVRSVEPAPSRAASTASTSSTSSSSSGSASVPSASDVPAATEGPAVP